jgi:acetoacetyl-CoA synthetase
VDERRDKAGAAPVLWTPDPARVEQAVITRFRRHLEASQGLSFATYEELWAWSVAELEEFWRALWEFFDVQADGDPTTVLTTRELPGARWFPDVRLSYVEHVFRDRDDDEIAVRHASELRPLAAWTWGDLRDHTARIRAGLLRLGVGPGDTVAAYLPNIAEALAAFFATASIGAIWSSCSPDFGVRSVVDRFAQIEPVVFLAVDGYRYGGKDHDRRGEVAQIAGEMPALRATVTLDYLGLEGDWDAYFPPTDAPLEFARLPFDHPLYVLYSSGTTGLPKAIVHGHGGILLEHLEWLGIQIDAKAGDRLFWFTTTGWMMWNALVSGLLTPASIVLYDGSPGSPDMGVLWDLAEASGITTMGVGAAYIHACMKAGVEPRDGRTLTDLRAIGSTGSPLSPEGFGWIYEQLGDRTWLFSTSGGTDVCSAFVGGIPTEPVRRGEIQVRHLGAAVEAFDEQGRSVVDEVGELVLTAPLPSFPVGFWNDPGDVRYHETYFSMFPGVWRHGDWIRITPAGSCVIYGRSDSTINRGGVRMGTAELYRAALAVEAVVDALAVDIPDRDGTGNSWLPLFVVLAEGTELTPELTAEIRRQIRTACSPRHVPDEVIQVAAVPRTLSGKVLEVPIKKILMGDDPAAAASRESLANPEAYDWFVAFARERAARRTSG